MHVFIVYPRNKISTVFELIFLTLERMNDDRNYNVTGNMI